MSISNNLAATKIDAGGVAGFGQSLAILHPELSPCGERYAFDQYGRPAAPDSLDTLVCPGFSDPSVRIEVENSLRSYLSPRYFNLPKGITQGTDTMFGRTTSAGRNFLDTDIVPLDANKLAGATKANPDLLLTRIAEGKASVAEGFAYTAPRSYLHYENPYSRY